MKTLLKFAIGAFIAHALFKRLLEQRSRIAAKALDAPSTAGAGRDPAGSNAFTLEELASDSVAAVGELRS